MKIFTLSHRLHFIAMEMIPIMFGLGYIELDYWSSQMWSFLMRKISRHN